MSSQVQLYLFGLVREQFLAAFESEDSALLVVTCIVCGATDKSWSYAYCHDWMVRHGPVCAAAR